MGNCTARRTKRRDRQLAEPGCATCSTVSSSCLSRFAMVARGEDGLHAPVLAFVRHIAAILAPPQFLTGRHRTHKGH